MKSKVAKAEEAILKKIFMIRGEKIMLDSDLAELYGVETKTFNQAVKRNATRFPEDFMFVLTEDEFKILRSQIVTSSWGGRRYAPRAFTEQGVAMLSSVLSSDTAIKVNIQIIRIFTKLRQILLSNKDILLKLEQLEKHVNRNSKDIELIFSALKQLLEQPNPPRKQIGFKRGDE
ncbi:MAG: ORF6N domain-containing protein [Saprospiraceae bacterium]